MMKKLGWLAVAALVLILVAFFSVRNGLFQNDVEGIVQGNGRIEAVEIDVAAKFPGRVSDILVHEGDFVTAGQVVAVMDAAVLEAQLRQALAQQGQAESAVAIARSQLTLRQAERAAAAALVAQRQAELTLAGKRYKRSSALAGRGAVSAQEADEDLAAMESAQASVNAAQAQLAAATAAIAAAQAQLSGAESEVSAAQAAVEKLRADIADTELKAARAGRVQYLVAQPGEVVSAGGRVLNLLDLSDVYMTFFCPPKAQAVWQWALKSDWFWMPRHSM